MDSVTSHIIRDAWIRPWKAFRTGNGSALNVKKNLKPHQTKTAGTMGLREGRTLRSRVARGNHRELAVQKVSEMSDAAGAERESHDTHSGDKETAMISRHLYMTCGDDRSFSAF